MSHNRHIPNTVYLDTTTAGEPPWTTARCNRLLRPITAQIKVLREIVYPQLNASASSASAALPKNGPVSKDKQQEDDETEHVGRRKSFDDPDWMPNATEKRGTKRLYTNRAPKTEARPAPQARKPGEISMPTPLIARQVMFGDSPRTHPQKPSAAGWRFLQTPKKRRFPMLKHDHGPDLRKGVTGSQLRHVERLLQAFGTLLRATQAPEGPRASNTGARSLMSTCLRQVPAYIEGRQQWEDEENVDKVDAGEEVYQDLEQMGSANGWRPLREVVRAHGVALVTTVIAEKLLDTFYMIQLVLLCHKLLALDEAQEILTAFVFVTAPLPPPKTAKDELIHFEDPRFSGMATAHAWAKMADDWPFFYRLLRSMLVSNLLPIEWTATAQFKHIWSRVIRNISDSSSPAHAEACKLTHTFLSLACGRSLTRIDETESDSVDDRVQPASVAAGVKNALNTTVSSLSAIFAAIFLLPDREASYGREGRCAVRHMLESIAVDITYDILAGHLDPLVLHSSAVIERLSNILTCGIITGVCTFNRIPDIAVAPVALHIRALAQLEKSTGQQLLNLPSIVCSVAESCGKAYLPKSPQNVFQVLRSMVEALKSYRMSPSDDGKFSESTLSSEWETIGRPSWFLKRLALESAHEFADHSQDSFVDNSTAYVQFTLDLERQMQDIQMPQYDRPYFNRDTDSYHVGYRWESGISEWVEATPIVARSSNNNNKNCAANPTAHHRPVEATDDLPSSPTKMSTPARRGPSLSQLLLANTTPDVLSNTPAIPTKRTSAPAPSTPVFTSTPAAQLRALRRDGSDEEVQQQPEDDGGYTSPGSETDADELAFMTSPVQPSPSPSPPPPRRRRSPPRKRARKSGSGGGGSRVVTLSSALGLDGADDSDDELSFL